MKNWKPLHKYRYLIAASAAIIIATFALVYMQYRSVQRAEEQALATLEANLDTHLLELVDEAKRDTLDHANHIMHSIRQQRVRERNLPSIERAFTRTLKRYPEVQDFYVVFFEREKENETWHALRFIPPDPNDPNVQKYDGAPVGKLIADDESAESLRRAWTSIQKEEQTTLYAAFDPQTAETAQPNQFFFHTVYELDRLKRDRELSSIGLLVFSAKPERFPSKNYLKKLVAKHVESDKSFNPLLGKLDYKISLTNTDSQHDLVSSGNTAGTFRVRRFDSKDGLFPNLSFGIASPGIEAQTYANQYTQTSILLGLGAAVLSLIGLSLTWRATRREMRVAQLKSDFLASISHELKTPLTAIRAFGDLLHSGRARDAERVREYGGLIKTESDRLTSLINNILEMSRLERGLRRYRLEEDELWTTVADTIEVFQHSTEAAGSEIKAIPPQMPIKANFDKSAIHQALLNLLSNAVKYTDTSSGDKPRVEVSLKTDASSAIIEVRDFGIGIAMSEQKHIFSAFHRAPDETVQFKRGTGLGLAIVREIARDHGGEISVESETEKGSIFRLYLPLPAKSKEKAIETISEDNINGEDFGHRGRAKRGYRLAR